MFTIHEFSVWRQQQQSTQQCYGRFLAQDALLIGIPWRWTQSAAVRGPRDTPSCRRAISSAVQAIMDRLKKLKYCSFCLNSHVGVSVLQASESAELGVCESCCSRAAVPQRPLFQEPGILFHKTWNGSIKKVTNRFDNFLGNFRGNESVTPLRHQKKSKLQDRGLDFLDGSVYLN